MLWIYKGPASRAARYNQPLSSVIIYYILYNKERKGKKNGEKGAYVRFIFLIGFFLFGYCVAFLLPLQPKLHLLWLAGQLSDEFFFFYLFISFLIPRIWYGQYCGRRCCRLNCARQQFAGRSRVATGGSWSSFNQYNFGGCNTMLMYNWAQFGSPLYICSAVAGRDCVSIKSAEHEEKKNKRGGRGSNQTGKPH